MGYSMKNDHLFDVYFMSWSTKLGEEFIAETPALELMAKFIGSREVVDEKRVETIEDDSRSVYIIKKVRKEYSCGLVSSSN